MGLDNPLHIAFLLVVLLMVFGAKRLPEMGKSLGHGLRGFKDAINPDAAAPAEQPALSSAHAQPLAVEHAQPLAVEHTEPLAVEHTEPLAVEHREHERAAA